jgi:flavorubredoxin
MIGYVLCAGQHKTSLKKRNKEDRLLFSSDAFGQHYAGSERLDEAIGDAICAG